MHYNKRLPTLMLPFLLSPVAQAVANTDDDAIEKIQVTGSYIKGAESSQANPVSVLDANELKNFGVSDVSDIINTLAVSSGAENRPDTFTSFYSQGTSNINLRGLGLSSTLVLINGKRQTISGAKAADGSVFVDTSAIPAIAIQRMEILKEGAAATYGSDAVAGVVNFITRDEFDGFKIEGSWQTTDKNSQTDKNLSVLGGFDLNDNTHVVLAASVLRRDPLNARERPELVDRAISSLGTSFILSDDAVVNSGPYAGSYSAGQNVPNPNCEAIGGTRIPNANGERCGFHYGLHYNIVNDEEREQYYAALSSEFDDGTRLKVTSLFTNYEILDNYTVPSYPNLTFPTISADHPDNPFGVDVTWLGRPYPFLDKADTLPAPRDNETFRIDAELSNDFGDSGSWYTSLAYSENEYTIQQPDMFASRLDLAVAGQGGPNGDLRYNPFDPLDESNRAVQDWVSTEFGSVTETSLIAWDGVVSNELFEWDAGVANIAVGAQIRHETYEVMPNDVTRINSDENGNPIPADFLFLGGVAEVDESRTSWAVFAELDMPLTDDLEMNAAVRYEHLDSGTSVDPKLALRYSVTDKLTLRASASTSFREPSLAQFYAQDVALRGIQDYQLDQNGDFLLDESGNRIPKGGVLFVRQTQNGNPDLEPEEATNYNAGVVWTDKGFQARIDYWRVDYKDVITIEDPQGKLLADPDGDDILRLDPNDPTSELGGVITNYFNASSVDAAGIDIEARYNFDLMGEAFEVGMTASHYLEYEIPLNGVKTDVAGLFNHDNFARSIPETKGNLFVHWTRDKHSVYARMNFVSSYSTTRITPEGESSHIESYTPVELQYRYGWELDDHEAEVTVGIINAFDEDPPEVYDAANFSYDPKHHDPRGRLFYIRAGYLF